MKVLREPTGVLKDGVEIERVRISNSRGVRVDMLSIGCVIEGLYVPDKNGHIDNIVLSYDDVASYLTNPDYLGCVVGRTAGRISGGCFKIGGESFELEKNNQNINFHGGRSGLHKRLWTVNLHQSPDRCSAVFSLDSPAGDGGYPGNVSFSVTYTLTEDNIFEMAYEGQTDAPTVINMTNHSYFNLSGNPDLQVYNHRLKIDANQFAPIQENGCPVGLLAGVDGTALDFRKEKTVGQDIGANETQIMRGGGFDHPLLLEKIKSPQISLSHPESGRSLKVWTDQDAVVIYTANHMDHKAICLETQNLPDHVNKKGFPFELVTPDRPYRAVTRVFIG